MRNLIRKTVKAGIALPFLVTLFVAPSAEALPTEFKAVYSATARNMTVGKAQFRLEVDGDRYRYSSSMQATGMIGLIVRDKIHETSSGKLTANGIRPVRYDYRRSGGSRERKDNIQFVGNGSALMQYKGDTRTEALPEGALDPLSLHIALMNDVASGQRKMRYLVAEPRRVRAYQLEVVGRERLKTPMGKLEAVRVDLTGIRKVDTADRSFVLSKAQLPPPEDGESTSFWFVPELDYMVVRIRHVDSEDGTVSIDLETVESRGTASESTIAAYP